MNREGLLAEVKRAMQPLVDRFGLHMKEQVDLPDFAEAVYVNGTTGITVTVDWLEFRPFVHLHELVNGEVPPDATSYNAASRLRSFDADDLLIIRGGEASPVGKMLAERDNIAAGRLVQQYAKALEEYAGDVLDGDFSVFEELDKVVKTRARQ